MNNTNKWTTEMKINLLKIEECERNRSCGFMKRMKEARDDIYKNLTTSAQTLRDNAARSRKDNLLLSLIEVNDLNDVDPEAIHKKAIENVEENEKKNENEIMKNINEEENGETRD